MNNKSQNDLKIVSLYRLNKPSETLSVYYTHFFVYIYVFMLFGLFLINFSDYSSVVICEETSKSTHTIFFYIQTIID